MSMAIGLRPAPAQSIERQVIALAKVVRAAKGPDKPHDKDQDQDQGKIAAAVEKVHDALKTFGMSDKQVQDFSRQLEALNLLSRQNGAKSSPAARLSEIKGRAEEIKERIEMLKRFLMAGGKASAQIAAELRQLANELKALGQAVANLGNSPDGDAACGAKASGSSDGAAADGAAPETAASDAAPPTLAAADHATASPPPAPEGERAATQAAAETPAKARDAEVATLEEKLARSNAEADFLRTKSEVKDSIENMKREVEALEKALRRKLDEAQRGGRRSVNITA